MMTNKNELDAEKPQLILTQNAAKTVYEDLNPENILCVYGVPGRQLTASSDGYSLFENGNNRFSFQLDSKGTASLPVIASRLASKDREDIETRPNKRFLSSLRVWSEADTTYTASGSMVFGYFYAGVGHIEAYSFTTGAPADGVTPCSIYVVINRQIDKDADAITYVNVNILLGNAKILDAETTPFKSRIKLSDEGTATIHIVSDKIGYSRIVLSLEQSPDGEYLPIDVYFVAIPTSYQNT